MHDINKPITLDDLTNPENSHAITLKKDNDQKSKLAEALRQNLKKEKNLKKFKIKNK